MRRAVGVCALFALVALHPARAEDPPSPENAAKLERAKQLDARAVELCQAALNAEAVSLVKESLRLREEALGPDHPDVATSLNDLGQLLYGLGQYAAARPPYERALKIREKALGPDHPAVALSLNNLAWLLATEGEYAAARPLYERALQIVEKAFGPEHLNVATILDNLAQVLDCQGQHAAARSSYERALQIREKALGPDHTDVATSLNNLALLLKTLGQYDSARPLYERALRINEKALGSDHPDVATNLNNLGALFWSEGRYDLARPILERALRIREKAVGPDHPDVAQSLNNLALLLVSEGQYAAARPLCERALKMREESLGPDHPVVAVSLNNLALLLWSQGQYAAARPLYERALKIQEESVGPEHRDVAVCLNNLAELLSSEGEYAAAQAFQERALKILEKALGPEHGDVATSVNNLAVILYSQGRYAVAQPLFERALWIREKALGPDHPDVAQSLNNLALLLVSEGQYAAARPLHERALQIREKALGPQHADVAQSLANLGLLLVSEGRYEAAPPLFERALRVVERGLRRGLAGLQGVERLRRVEASLAYLDRWLGEAPKCGRTGYEEALRIRGLVTRAEAAERALLRVGGNDVRARREEILALDRQLGGLSSSVPLDAEKRQAWRNHCAEIAAKREALLLSLAKDYAPVREAEERLDLTLSDVQAKLEGGALLIDLLRMSEGYVAFLVPPKGDVVRIDLGGGIDEAARAFAAAVARGHSDGPGRGLDGPATGEEDGGERLYELVVAPIRKRMPAGVRRIYLCPDAALAAVPFAALPGSRPGTTLLDEFEIVYVEMAQDLVPPATAPKPGVGALVVGGVDYGKSEPLPSSAPSPLLVQVDRAPREGERWDPLPGTAKEAELLHERIPGDLLCGPTATEDRFRALCRGKAVLHLATHGYVRTDRLARTLKLREEASRFDAGMERQVAVGIDPMLLAGVVFAGANTGDGGAGDDGLLTAAEASWLDLDGVRLAVLSACETGRGTPAAGEGTLGLVRGFRLAGARTVVASLWRVDDAATALLMERFYDGFLGRKLSPAAALREAALAVRAFADKDGKRPFAAPRYWAAFVAYGP